MRTSNFAPLGSSLVLPLLLLACDDPADPCAGIACDVEGVDLAVTVADVAWAADQPFDARVGRRVVQPGDDLAFRYRVVNLGNETSDSARLWVGLQARLGNLGGLDPAYGDYIDIDPLEPGEAIAGTLRVRAPEQWLLHTAEIYTPVRIESPEHSGTIHHDADPTNDFGSVTYHLATPYVTVQVSTTWDSLRVGNTREATVTVFNASHFAALDAGTIGGFCVVYRIDEPGWGSEADHCWGGFHSVVDVPALGPREFARIDVTLAPPGDAVPLDAPAGGTSVLFCVDRAQLSTSSACSQPAFIPVAQDLDAACAPPVVAPGAMLDAADDDARCAHRDSNFDVNTYHVWAFDAAASALREIQLLEGELTGVRIFGPNQTPLPMSAAGEFFVPAAGRYHVVVQPTETAFTYRLE